MAMMAEGAVGDAAMAGMGCAGIDAMDGGDSGSGGMGFGAPTLAAGTADTACGKLPAGSSAKLVALLLNFLKQYHLEGQDEYIRAMLRDITADGCNPRPLGSWGVLSSRDVGEALAAFEVWKAEGRLDMPAWYKSGTHKLELTCVVVQKNQDSTLNLNLQPVTQTTQQNLVKHRADPLLVRPRPVPNWFVPSPEGQTVDDTQTADSSIEIGSNMAANPVKRLHVKYPFDGVNYGAEYLALDVGDELEELHEDRGWAYGRVLRRARDGQNIPLAGTQECGWYPTDFAAPIQHPLK